MLAASRHGVRVLVATLLVALAIPAAAVAGSGSKCNASACKVYVEQSAPSAGKGQTPPSAGAVTGGKTAHVPKKTVRVLALAGNDRAPLKDLLAGSSVGSLRGGNVGAPSVLGAAFDLGAGPLALLAILLATALGLAARGSVRGWLQRRATQ